MYSVYIISNPCSQCACVPVGSTYIPPSNTVRYDESNFERQWSLPSLTKSGKGRRRRKIKTRKRKQKKVEKNQEEKKTITT